MRDLFIKHKSWDAKNPSYIDKMLNLSKQVFPQYVNEIQGLADGAGYEFRELFIHNSMHIPDLANCSTGIIKFSDKIYLAHNEDFNELMGENSYFLYVELEDNKGFFSHCYPGVLPGMSFGFNSEGLMVTCNSLPDPTKSVGVSRILFG